MKYTKPPLSFEEQAKLLIRRGLIVNNEIELLEFLKNVNYYRLSGYLYPFKQIDPVTQEETYFPDTTLSTIKYRYEFDRQLRLLLMDAIEKIEVAVLRTQFAEKYSLTYGAFGYTDYKNYRPQFAQEEFNKLMSKIRLDEEWSREEFIKRYHAKYDEEKYLPFWMAVELMSFGQLLTLYRNTPHDIQKYLAKIYGVPPIVLDSWMHTLHYIRNACAHHVRIWNRILPVAPLFPYEKHDPNWHYPAEISNKYIFAVLTIIRYLLAKIDQENHIYVSMVKLIEDNSEIPIDLMGFPENWREIKYWQDPLTW